MMSLGWQRVKQTHACLIHIDIIDAKVWIQRDGTEYGIANELVDAGIPKEHIVLGFHEPNVPQHTGFPVVRSHLSCELSVFQFRRCVKVKSLRCAIAPYIRSP